METLSKKPFRSGWVGIFGKPNVGKSSLLNAFLGEKLAIVTPKPQTTRHQIRGILSDDHTQMIFVDTPGISPHFLKFKPPAVPAKKERFAHYLWQEALSALEDLDLLLFVVDFSRAIESADREIWKRVRQKLSPHTPAYLVVNKSDLPGHDSLRAFTEEGPFTRIFHCSATTGAGIGALLATLRQNLPEHPAYFPASQLSDRNDRFLVAEIVREHLFKALSQEIPYSITVEVENFHEGETFIHIDAVIFVSRESHKGIVIGKNGALLKRIGTDARKEIEGIFGKQICLKTKVKVLARWTEEEHHLRRLGFGG